MELLVIRKNDKLLLQDEIRILVGDSSYLRITESSLNERMIKLKFCLAVPLPYNKACKGQERQKKKKISSTHGGKVLRSFCLWSEGKNKKSEEQIREPESAVLSVSPNLIRKRWRRELPLSG